MILMHHLKKKIAQNCPVTLKTRFDVKYEFLGCEYFLQGIPPKYERWLQYLATYTFSFGTYECSSKITLPRASRFMRYIIVLFVVHLTFLLLLIWSLFKYTSILNMIVSSPLGSCIVMVRWREGRARITQHSKNCLALSKAFSVCYAILE